MARVWAVQPATQQAQVRVGSTGACASAPCPCTHANNQCPPAPLPSRAPHRQLPLRAGAAGGCRRPPQPVEPVRQRAVVRHARGGGPCAPVAGGHHGGAGHRRPGCGRHPAATPPHLPGGWGFNGVVRAAVGRAVGLPGMHWVAHIQQSAAGSTACHPPCLLTLHCRCGCRPPAPAWCWPPMGCGTQSRAAVWCACCASTPSPRQQPWRLCRRWPHSAAACSLTTSLVGLLGRGRRRVMADASVVHHPHCGCRVQPGYCSAY